MDDYIPQASGKPRNEATIFLLEAVKEIQDEINIQFVPQADYESGNNSVCFLMFAYTIS